MRRPSLRCLRWGIRLSAGYTTHIKINPRKKEATESSGESPQRKDSPGEPHPARRWVVERTISWLVKRRSLRTRWSKKAETGWPSFSLPALTCCSIWRFSDRVLHNPISVDRNSESAMNPKQASGMVNRCSGRTLSPACTPLSLSPSARRRVVSASLLSQ